MEFDGDTDKYIYTAEVKTSLYILDKKVKRLVHIDSVFFLLFLPQIRDFPHEVLQTEEKCAFD